MHVTKLRIRADERGFVPVGEYFKRVAEALRQSNAEAVRASPPRTRVRGKSKSEQTH